ncbi:MAG TPA: hypothetical protein VNX86_11060 [Rhizomicrobium sp.]|nr:hypothetical protein [Rhizomicrobium sp.]
MDDNVVVSEIPSPGAPWSKPVPIANNSKLGLPQSVSVNSCGQAVLSHFDPNEIFGTFYNPQAPRQHR